MPVRSVGPIPTDWAAAAATAGAYKMMMEAALSAKSDVPYVHPVAAVLLPGTGVKSQAYKKADLVRQAAGAIAAGAGAGAGAGAVQRPATVGSILAQKHKQNARAVVRPGPADAQRSFASRGRAQTGSRGEGEERAAEDPGGSALGNCGGGLAQEAAGAHRGGKAKGEAEDRGGKSC